MKNMIYIAENVYYYENKWVMLFFEKRVVDVVEVAEVANDDASSDNLFFNNVFSNLTAYNSSSISATLFLNSSTSFWRWSNISRVVLFCLTVAAIIIVDDVGTPIVDIEYWMLMLFILWMKSFSIYFVSVIYI